MLARRNRFEHQGLGNAVAANQFDHDVNVCVGDHGARVAHHLDAIAHEALRPCHIEVRHHGDLDATARATLDFFLVAPQHVERARAHNTHAQQAYLNRFHKCF